MNDVNRWEKNNEQYLSAALAWLRLLLARMATSNDAAETELSQALEASNAAERNDPPPALPMLSQRLGLSRFEQNVLLLCAAMELDTRIPELCARAQDDPNRLYPTFALAMILFDDPAWDAISPNGALRYWRLIEIHQHGAQPLVSSPLKADERIVSYLKGLNYLDDRLNPLLTVLDLAAHHPELPPSQSSVAETIARRLGRMSAGNELPVIQLVGPDSDSKRLVACHTAAALGRHLYRLPAELLSPQTDELETLARLWQRESILLPVALYLDVYNVDRSAPVEGGTPAPAFNRFLGRTGGLVFLDTREIWPDLGRPAEAVDVGRPTPVEQRKVWEDAMGEVSHNGANLLAGQFDLSVPTIHEIARTALTEASSNGSELHDRIWQACLVGTRPRMDALAQRIDPKATWDDIVLPDEEKEALYQIAEQVRQRGKVYDDWGFRSKMNRGLGISALFSGESGTGKTMAAEVIANELCLNLYRIDLSAVVSKYIGETEKNLRRLFDGAENGGAILFFDEADALFGKRSEVKDSHDRYANIEINYLLQRMEAYNGLAILATNMKSALDAAFMRRLRFVVNFPFPGPEQRRLIWQKIYPKQTPINGLDLDRLARFNLAGGNIHNISLNAAFLAAKRDSSVNMPLILQAIRTEYRKLERPIRDHDLQWQDNGGESP